MNILWLLLPSLFALLLLLVHSYYYRGLRITVTFFSTVFLFALIKENSVYYLHNSFEGRTPYIILNPTIKILHAPLAVCVGWIFTLYLSWYMAEKILERVAYFEKKLFQVLVLGGLIAASVAYCVEATGTAVGWWKWTFTNLSFSNFLVSNSMFIPIKNWFFIYLNIMFAYLIIECSDYRKKTWRFLFILPFILNIILRLYIFCSPVGYKLMNLFQYSALTLLVYFSFKSSLLLRFHLREDMSNKCSWKPFVSFIEQIPAVTISLMFLILIFANLYYAKKSELLISLLPALSFFLLSIRKIRFSLIFACSLALLFFCGQKFFFAFIPALYFLVILILSKYKIFNSIILEGKEKEK